MASLSPEGKNEVSSLFAAGTDPKVIEQSICEKYGCHPMAVRGVIQQERYRTGEAKRPSGPRKVREQKTVTYDEPDPTDQARQQPYSPASNGFGPLFSGTPGQVERVEIHRSYAMPRHAGTGVVGETDAQITGADIQAMWGGGRYLCKAFDANGRLLATKAIPVAGPSRPVDIETNEAVIPSLHSWQQPDSPAHRSIEEILLIERERNRMEREERDRRESMDRADRERRDRQDREDRERWWAQQRQEMQEGHTRQLQMVQAMNKGGGLGEIVAVVKTIKEMADPPSEEGGDALTAVVKAAPQMLESIKGIAMSRAMAGPAPAGAPGAQADMTQEQAAKVFYDSLIAQGMSPEEAMKALQTVGKYLTDKVEAKQAKLAKNTPAVSQQQAAPGVASSGNSPSSAPAAPGVAPPIAPAAGPMPNGQTQQAEAGA